MAEPYPVGTEVEKIESQPGDMHHNGSVGRVVRVLGSMAAGTVLGNGEVVPRLEFGYFVQWRDFPVPVFIRGSRLALRKKPHAS